MYGEMNEQVRKMNRWEKLCIDFLLCVWGWRVCANTEAETATLLMV